MKGRLARRQADWVERRAWEQAASRSVEKGGTVEVGALRGRRDDGVGGECGWDNCRMREEMGKQKREEASNEEQIVRMRHRLDLLAQSDTKFPITSTTDDVKRSILQSPFGSLFYMVFREPGAYDASRFGPSEYSHFAASICAASQQTS